MPLGDKDNQENKQTFFVPFYSRGLATARDTWCYNASKIKLTENIKHTITFYNSLVQSKKEKRLLPGISGRDISMTRAFQSDLEKEREKTFHNDAICTAFYRPFNKTNCYFHPSLNEMVYKMLSIFPENDSYNAEICVSGVGSQRGFSCMMANKCPNLDFVIKSQCFPLYHYEKKSIYHPTLFDGENNAQYTRKDGITSFILERCRERYGPKLTKEDIFYYVYGVLHSKDYLRKFDADLNKMLPRLPLVEKPVDFWVFSKAGRALAELHLKYETQPACPKVKVEGVESGNFRVEKMRFPNKGDKSVIEYNPWITISNIPLDAYDYVLNGRSAIEWIMERYQIKTDKASGITNDPNDWATEHGKPRYILDLLLSIVTVSLETLKIIKTLPQINEFRSA